MVGEFDIPNNLIVKRYPHFTHVYVYNEYFHMNFMPKKHNSTKKDSDDLNGYRSIRRTRTTIQDIVLSNEFDFFSTFTFAQDRDDIDKCKRKMSHWLHEMQRKGKIKYLIVPEFHKDKKAIHFHAITAGSLGPLVYTGLKRNKRDIYNILDYKYGYSTAVMIENPEQVSSYIRKYITKDMIQFKNKSRYWCSTGLQRPEVDTLWRMPLAQRSDFFSDSVKVFANKKWELYRIDNERFNKYYAEANNTITKEKSWQRTQQLSLKQHLLQEHLKKQVNNIEQLRLISMGNTRNLYS